MIGAACILAACAPSDGTGSGSGSRPGTGNAIGGSTTTIVGEEVDPGGTIPPVPSPSTTIAPAPTTGPPQIAGVTYRDIDGGSAYFSQWQNSFPDDPAFFPVAVWAETLADPSFAPRYKDLGVNTFANLWNGVDNTIMDQLAANDMYAISGSSTFTWDSAFNSRHGGRLASMYFQDEGDGHSVCGYQPAFLKALCATDSNGRTTPQSIQAMSDAIRAKDGTRPIYGQYTKPVALGAGLTESQRRAYVNSADIVSFDYYPLTDKWTPGQVWDQAEAVQNVRQLADYSKPVWAFIETSHVFPEATYRPTGADVSAEAWNAVIGGARGIQYFNHNFKPGFESGRVLLDSRYTDIATAVKTTNLQIQGLARVINSPFADGLATVTSGSVNVMSKGYDGSVYLFVAPTTRDSQTVSLSLTGIGDATATVLHEGRSVPVTGGVLTDSFANQNTVHIYRITPGS